MNIEDQVCNLENSKKLEELNIKIDFQLFRYDEWDGKSKIRYFTQSSEISGEKAYPAYTASELFDLLPMYIDTKKNEPFNGFRFNMQMQLLIIKDVPTKVYSINYHCDTMQFDSGSPWFAHKLFDHNLFSTNLADAAAQTLIYLIENGHVKHE